MATKEIIKLTPEATQGEIIDAINNIVSGYINDLQFDRGAFYTFEDSMQVVTTTAGVAVKVTGWTVGEKRLSTVSDADDDITVSDSNAGIFLAWFSASIKADKAAIIEGDVIADGAASNRIAWTDQIINANQWTNVCAIGLISLGVGDVLDARILSSATDTTIDVNNAQFGIIQKTGTVQE